MTLALDAPVGARTGGDAKAATRFVDRPPFGLRDLLILALVVLALGWTGDRVRLGDAVDQARLSIGAALGLNEPSQLQRAADRIGEAMFPPVLAERTDVSRIEGFDAADLPPLAYVETETQPRVTIDPATLEIREETAEVQVLVEPLGYLAHVGVKMVETFEIALWGTLLAVALGGPLAIWAAANYAPHPTLYAATRGLVAGLLAVPEMISALFLVLAFGFGPLAGVLALGLHTAGFLAKFIAEDIENADRKPQEALQALGASRLKVLLTAVLPQSLPQYVAYVLYVLDRNVRTATVIGIVGAGGIGQELKGRYDMFAFGHVATILIAIVVAVVVLDQLAAVIRRRLL